MPLDTFHPTLARWFEDTFAEPSAPQRQGWPAIRKGDHTLIAAPTGTGKTLAAFLTALDTLFRQGDDLPPETQVLYISPLKALGNDIQKNLQGPLDELRERDPSLPDIRVFVRSGDTPASQRAAMAKRPPHVLVTTPESFYILLTSGSGRRMLSTVRTVIVDEIHAVLGSKRGSHLALSLERLEALAGPVQRIGLSATQKPLSDVAHFLCGERPCTQVDVGHRRELDLAMEIPPSELSTVCSHEVWDEIYERMVALIQEHRTTLVFTNTRKLAERIAARLTDKLDEDAVTSHHGSLSKARRLDAERRLKEGSLRALVATASLELGIDIGDIDLVIQVGATNSIATFIQRVGRAGHSVGKIPKGRLFPLTNEELIAGTALLRATERGDLDRTPMPGAPLDILAQHIVAACVPEDWDEDALFRMLTRAWPYRDLERERFDAILEMHAGGRLSLLHRDGVNGRVRATRRAPLISMSSGGAIPDKGEYRVVVEPEGTHVGSLDEDFAIETSAGDVFQLGNASWRVLRVAPGKMHVADAHGIPSTLPFWFGEAPSRTAELCKEMIAVREDAVTPDGLTDAPGLPFGAREQVEAFTQAGHESLGCIPSQDRLVIERFFDETGGMQLVLHSPFGSRINRAYGLALRKRFCRGFGFELQAAATEDAIVLSLGPQHSFKLEDVFDYLHPNTGQHVLEQALLPTPFFKTRWRWNATRSLLLPRMNGGKRLPIAIARMRADDLLVAAFPEVLACPETLDGPDIDIPREHPIVQQTMHDCLHEYMDLDGYLDLITRLRNGQIERVAVDTSEPSSFARGILNSAPYTFLDDAPLEERRTRAVMTRHLIDPKTADELGALDPDAVARVKAEAWPEPRDADELHEALLWIGYITDQEATHWQAWLTDLHNNGRVEHEDGRWYATEASRDPVEMLRGRMEALGPVELDDPARHELERKGELLRVRLNERDQWCNRRLLARIHRYTIDRLRDAIAPVHANDFLRFLSCWQHIDADYKVTGPRGVETVLRQLAGYEIPCRAWERDVLPARITDYRRDHLDQVALSGAFAWGRFWGGGAAALKQAPISFVPREDLHLWQALAGPADLTPLSGPAHDAYDTLQQRGPLFPQDLQRHARLIPTHLEMALTELIARGLITCDSFAPVRQLLAAPHRRKHLVGPMGRWCLLRHEAPTEDNTQDEDTPSDDTLAEFVARRLLERTGVVFRRTIMRERLPIPWRRLLRVYRHMELKGEVRGGRFVAGFDGEQYALPEAVPFLRKIRSQDDKLSFDVSAADPLNFRGILTPDSRVSPTSTDRVHLAGEAIGP